MAFIATPESIAALGLTRVKPRGLSEKHFWMMMGVAAVVHFFVLLAVEYWPREDVHQIPVRTMNIKLGGGQSMQQLPKEVAEQVKPQPAPPAVKSPAPAAKAEQPKKVAAPVPSAKPAPPIKQQAAPAAKQPIAPVAAPKPQPLAPTAHRLMAPKAVAVDDMVRHRPAQNPIPANVQPKVQIDPSALAKDHGLQPLPQLAALDTKPSTQPMAAQQPAGGLAMQPQQRVRAAEPTLAQQAGVQKSAPIPDETPEARAIRARYEQVVSQWLEEHKQYPPAARMLGQQGQPVLRIRMDRTGNIKFSSVDKSSGYRLIDDAAMEMVRRADPFPKPPENYPGDKLVEFLIPVAFKIN